MSLGRLVKCRFLFSCWAITSLKGFFSPGGLGNKNFTWEGWVNLNQNCQVFPPKKTYFIFLLWRCLKVWSFQKCKCSGGCQEGSRDVETSNWWKHYWWLWKEGSVSIVCKEELEFIQSILCMKWLNINFNHSSGFPAKNYWITKYFLGFKRNYGGSNI